MENNREYTAEQIKVLDGMEAVRKRPAMYIGSTDFRGVHHLIFEVVDNSVDEAVAGFCKNIQVIIHIDNSITVSDDGRGIPVDVHPDVGRPAVEVVMTTLHAGGKFDSTVYKVSGGLHGVGVSVVNALSEWLEVEVRRDGKIYRQRYERGRPVTSLEVIGDTTKTGTKVSFLPDKEIFPDITISYDYVASRLRELAFLNPGLRIVLRDERTDKEEEFYYEGGIKSLVEYLNEGKTPLYPQIFYMNRFQDDVIVEIAFQHNTGYTETLYSFANNIRTVDGGTHVSGFRSAFTRCINQFAQKNNLLKGLKGTLTGDDLREGLTAVISVKVPNPQFEGQTKTKLGNSEVKGILESLFAEELNDFLERYPEVGKLIVEKALAAAKAREAARKAKELVRKKSKIEGAALPGKLADCSERDPRKRELFIVEGESAGGSAKQGRDRSFQAILPLKGKILNVEKARVDKVLSNQEIRSIILALGAGVEDSEFDISKLRYNKIIIMTDADVDGAHIRTLLLTFFFRKMRKLVEEGHVYVALPPLYRVKKGRVERYCQNDEELEAFLFEEGLKGLVLQVNGEIIEGDRLKKIVERVKEYKFLENKFRSRGKDPKVISALARFNRVEEALKGIALKEFEDFLKGAVDVKAFNTYPDEAGYIKVEVVTLDQEEELCTVIDRDFVSTPRFRRFREITTSLSHLISKQLKAIKDGKTEVYIPNIESLYSTVLDFGRKGAEIQRYKGLGEMNPEQLWETTMNPATRRLKKVTVEDAEEADRIFSILMGDDVAPRRNFIQSYAKEAKNIDV
ncbi:DNA gyrase subunit B [Thermosulfidibacter takaii ABI70S6]|uniref:DNA gyrase subunit B n=1 Tax=Thermosulfidibacter takaii (strain DSM 17441 / JCM 13301 / NBRC 103674 / ABI70S6) TaxID=1298851 RepID=A0A0S3QR51_THET7|nr:DNA topoisomerase (ATP-hydrolyzing) subunit B [Thermosulfidibacter takaii]BAT70814.1 DNA gyrase subunit B [Thermosulfidibacter takaii ABI70S6]